MATPFATAFAALGVSAGRKTYEAPLLSHLKRITRISNAGRQPSFSLEVVDSLVQEAGPGLWLSYFWPGP